MSIFYDPSKMFSYNALFNFIVGERGVGKTYGMIKFCVQRFLNHGEQFVYLRRYKSELEQKYLNKFFEPFITNSEFEDHALEVKGNVFVIDGQIAGYAINLSTSGRLKSVPFDNVGTIIFDEFLIQEGSLRYIKNEVVNFLESYETVSRLRDIRVCFLGNAISSVNPYFDYFGLSLPYNSEFRLFKDGLILVNYIKNVAYREAKKKSRFGQLVEGTDYGKYAIDNEWLLESKAFIGKKRGNCRNYSIVVVGGHKYGVWVGEHGYTYVSKDFDPNNPCVFAFNFADHDEKSILVNARTSAWFKPVLIAFKSGTLYFENQTIKADFGKVIRKCLY